MHLSSRDNADHSPRGIEKYHMNFEKSLDDAKYTVENYIELQAQQSHYAYCMPVRYEKMTVDEEQDKNEICNGKFASLHTCLQDHTPVSPLLSPKSQETGSYSLADFLSNQMGPPLENYTAKYNKIDD